MAITFDYKKDVEWMMDNLKDVMREFFYDKMKTTNFEVTPNDSECETAYIVGEHIYNTEDVELLLDAMSCITEKLGSNPKSTKENIYEVEKLIAITILLRRLLIYNKSIGEEDVEVENTELKTLLQTLKAFLICSTSYSKYCCSNCPFVKYNNEAESCNEDWSDERLTELIEAIDKACKENLV